MSPIIFATTNEDKFYKAQINLRLHGIELVRNGIEMQEMQSLDGEVIARDKAQQAYDHFQQPVLVNDDTWSIPALRGFPATDMKLCNHFLVAEDWLRLMAGKEDRRALLISFYAYHDGKTIQTIQTTDERYFLDEVRGQHPTAPCLEVIARKNSTQSVAEQISIGLKTEEDNAEFWKELADLVAAHS